MKQENQKKKEDGIMAGTRNVRHTAGTATTRPAATRTTGARRAQAQRNGRIYQYDNTARQLDVRRAIEEQPVKRLSNTTRKNRDRAVYMNLGYVLFLVAAMAVTAMVLINYIQLQSRITNNVTEISRMESCLNELKLANDEEYSRITSSIDLEEIKRIAIGELGMTYASEGQVVTYTNEGSDYVKQLADIPE